MNKKVLAIYFSQSGQLGEIIDHVTVPLNQPGVTVEKVVIQPATQYPFPWKGNHFFAVMPDCVLGNPGSLVPFELKEEKYDLIILGYQAWFLSPSIPLNTLISNEVFRKLLKDTPVVTVTGARNMWITAFEKLKGLIKGAGGQLVGNVALVDKHANFVSFITIFYWMLTGKKERFLNIFPKPGVSDQDISGSGRFGEIISSHLALNKWDTLQDELLKKKAVVIRYKLMYIESKASKIFRIWANFISKRKNKEPWLVLFKYYLLIALFLAAPIILTFDAIFIRPFSGKKIRERKLLLSGVN